MTDCFIKCRSGLLTRQKLLWCSALPALLRRPLKVYALGACSSQPPSSFAQTCLQLRSPSAVALRLTCFRFAPVEFSLKILTSPWYGLHKSQTRRLSFVSHTYAFVRFCGRVASHINFTLVFRLCNQRLLRSFRFRYIRNGGYLRSACSLPVHHGQQRTSHSKPSTAFAKRSRAKAHLFQDKLKAAKWQLF